MDLTFLPKRIYDAIINISIDKLFEIRLRTNFPIILNYKNQFVYLSYDGITMFAKNAIICINNDIEYIINFVTEHSIYAFNESIKNGFITTKDGIRIGLAGECVINDGQVRTIKNYSSINLRIPHEVLGCANDVYKYIYSKDKLNNSLIISPPSCGKTTILKDLARLLNENKNINSILIIDERGEFSSIFGEKIDNIKYSNKLFAFNSGIRSLSPQIVITDELMNEKDWECVALATFSGVKIIATCHGGSIENITNKPYFINNIFNRYIILENKLFSGKLDKVYDENFNLI